MKKAELQNYIRELEEGRYSDPAKLKAICKELLSISKKENDSIAKAYAECYIAITDYRQDHICPSTLKHLHSSIHAAHSLNLFKLEVRARNMLGIISATRGDGMSALECYETALSIAISHRLYDMIRTVSNNIGDLFMRLCEYDTAQKYFNQAIVAAKKSLSKKSVRDSFSTYVGLNTCMLNNAVVEVKRGNFDKALEIMSSIEKIDDRIVLYYNACLVTLTAACLINLQKDEEAEAYIEQAIKYAENNYEMNETIEDYAELCNQLIQFGRFPQARRLLDAIGSMAKQLNYVEVWCFYLRQEINYKNAIGDTTGLLDLYKEYCDYKDKLNSKFIKQQISSIYNRNALSNEIRKFSAIEERNKKLKVLSEHDALTGLNNRYVLNEVCEKWVEECKQKKLTFSIISLDIDYFKQFNDTFGHLAGDEALKAISQVLSETSDSNELAIRYGGDEFFIISKNKTDTDIITHARKIAEGVRSKKIAHAPSTNLKYVSVTQGAINAIPSESQTLMDFIHLADVSLYKAKLGSRGTMGYQTLNNNEYDYSNYKFV